MVQYTIVHPQSLANILNQYTVYHELNVDSGIELGSNHSTERSKVACKPLIYMVNVTH